MLFKLNTTSNAIINDEVVSDLINVVNSLQPMEDLTIYLKGQGGELGSSNAIIDILNETAKFNNVYLIGYESLESCHFQIMFQTLCQGKKLLSHTFGMLHKSFYPGMQISEGGLPKNDDYNNFMFSLSRENGEMSFLAKSLNLTKEEKKRFNNNSEVYFSSNRMQELLEFNKKKTIIKPIKYSINENN